MSDEYASIPRHTREALDRYAQDGVRTGSFLRAVLCDNLFEAVQRADMENKPELSIIVKYVYNRLPCECWGSEKRVDAFLKNHPKRR